MGKTSWGAGGRRRWIKIVSVVTALAVLPVIGVINTPTAPAAIAAPASPAVKTVDYPSWQDVQNAIAGVKNAEALAKQIEAQIAALAAEVARTQADAEAKGQVYADAQQAVDEQQLVVSQLQAQADAAKAEADKQQKIADKLLAQLSKPGGGSLTSTLIADPGKAEELLYRIGAMQKLTESSNSIYTKALQLKNSAQALTDQAGEAQAELDRRKAIAEAALIAAQAAADAAQSAYDAEQEHKAQLEAQLVVLREKRDVTAADYQKGLEARWGAGAAGEVNPQTGWARPAKGYISSSFGRRFHPIYHTWKLHSGTDLAGMGCGAPIYAAHGGTVSYSGPNGDLGNYIQIENGDGTSTGYGHIIAGGLLVHRGQSVAPGQNIARVGSTGGSTGCHLHFMIRINGNLTDPVPFMRSQGMPIG